MDTNKGHGRIAPLTGIAFVVLVIVGFILAGEPPDAKQDNARELVEHFTDKKDEAIFGAALAMAGSALFVFFGAFLRSLLIDSGDRSFFPTVVFAGTVIFATGVAIDSTITFTLAETADDISPDSVVTLGALWENDFMPFALGGLLFLSALGLSTVRHGGVLPKWLGWVLIVLAVTAVTPIGYVAIIGMALLVIIISVMLVLRAGRSGRSGTMPPDDRAAHTA